MKTENRMRRICLLILLLVATAMNVSAAKYDLWIAGVQVTDANKDDLSVINGVSGTVKYNPSTKTLTLANATIALGFDTAIENKIDGLTINVIGTNSISSGAAKVIYSYEDVEISGSGTLAVNAKGSTPHGIYLQYCNLTVSGCALTVTAPDWVAINFLCRDYQKMTVTNGAHLNLKGVGCIIGTIHEGISRLNLEVLGNETLLEADNAEYVGSVDAPCMEAINQIIFGDGIAIKEPAGAHIVNGFLRNADGTACKSVKIGDLTPPVRRIDITDYTWPTDFEPADYEVTSPTEGVKSVRVVYSMFGKTLDLYEAADVCAGYNLGVIFTVELEDGYEFPADNDYSAFIERDGVQVHQEERVLGSADNQKRFVWTYTVPTPEGGIYMRTAKDSITAPVIGAEPVWEITAAAGAKPAGTLPETNPKEQFQRDGYCPVNEINWWEYAGEEGWKLMERGDVFKAGKKYFVEMLASSVSGQQFHDRTVYEVNGKVAKAIDNTPPVKIPTEEGAHYIRVAPTETKMCYVFRQLPFRLSDVNRDCSISMADANMVVNYFLTAEKPTGFPVHLANVNGDYDEDGNPLVTMADANLIVNAFLSGTELQLFDPVNGHEYVDLGLSVKWATCNVGADNPEDYGDYFAWGETTPKDSYSWETYKWCEGSNTTLTKYNSSSNYGTVDNRTTLAPADDAATANWHGAWRMPTKQEQTALRDSCYWEWTRNYNGKGVSGYIVYKAKVDADMGIKKYSGSTTKTSATYSLSDTHIFLPAAGYHEYTDLLFTGSNCDYWSSSLNESGSDYASWRVFCNPDYVKYNSYLRSFGFSVRPVLP